MYIPPRTTVLVPLYTVHRDPRNFREPEQFIPERWSSTPEQIIRKKAVRFVLSTGTYSCVAKPFAMMELRLLLATIIGNFDLEAPASDVPQSFDTMRLQGHRTVSSLVYRVIA
ncbi:cytochrome P450 [Aspergillus pseudoustus]|uniref:Cytochrome P450 n=1 Tax=Aspergillus pseudoustus TaxID=1810923 RepID=A0ABR4L0A9_9EURO